MCIKQGKKKTMKRRKEDDLVIRWVGKEWNWYGWMGGRMGMELGGVGGKQRFLHGMKF